MKRVPINNGTLRSFVWSSMFISMISMFKILENRLFLIAVFSKIVTIAHIYCKEKFINIFKLRKSTISSTLFIRWMYQGNPCELDIVIFALFLGLISSLQSSHCTLLDPAAILWYIKSCIIMVAKVLGLEY